MKRSLSLVLAVLMVIALVPFTALSAFATESTASSYLVYQQDFGSVESDAVDTALMEQLGWYVPFSKADTNGASYSVVEKKDAQGNVVNKALRVDARDAAAESFVNVLGGDVMPLLRKSSFTLEYRLTYSELTTNNDGYAALIYNYNEQSGSVANGEGNEAYGIAAIRMCGTGFNAVYYPVSGANCAFYSLEKDGQDMASRFDDPTDTYSSLYARLFPEAANEVASCTYTGTNVMKNRVLDVKIDYDYEAGITLSINGIVISKPEKGVTNAGVPFSTEKLWDDFASRNGGSTIALLVQPGVVADIDNIVISTTSIDVTDSLNTPGLLITEVSTLSEDYWTNFIEIHNPTDEAIDVANYSLIKGADYTDGYATDNIGTSRTDKFSSYIKLGDLFGKEVRNRDAQFFNESELASILSWDYATQWYFTEAQIAEINKQGADYAVKVGDQQYTRGKKAYKSNNYTYTAKSGGGYFLCDLADGVKFTKDASNEFVPDANGTYFLVNYVENWNTQYVRGNDDYATNTMLNPGDTMLLVMLPVGYLPAFTGGMINNGLLSQEYSSQGFRYTYRNYGVTKEVKLLALEGFVMNDMESAISGNTSAELKNFALKVESATLAIGRTENEQGVEINYKEQRITDFTNLESLVRYNPILSAGRVAEADTMFESGTIGTGGYYRFNSSAVYVYGVDASSDYRVGSLYNTANPIRSSIKDNLNTQWHMNYSTGTQHVGKLADYQDILFNYVFDRTAENPPLMITEILPVTQNLAGEDKRAFTAIELTNTAGKAVNVYDYALTRTKSGIYNNNTEKGFTYSTVMRPGNPVDRGEGNGAYYYFAQDSISNPETCVLQPGESVVVWFLNADTYTSYYNDDEFGFEYFRQYWVNNGCPDLGLQSTDGEYAVKVIAVDGCNDETYNAPNYGRVFSPAYGTYYKDQGKLFYHNTCAIYGVAKQTNDVLNGKVLTRDVVSIAYFGLASAYYELNKVALPATDGSLDSATGEVETYYTNVQKCSNAPVNTGMRYVVGATYSNRVSAMKQTMKVNYSAFSNNKVYYSKNPTATLNHELRTNNALSVAGLGVLEGVEAYGVADTLFRGTQEGNTTVYRYFAQHKNIVTTLSGAAVSTTAGATTLRFDGAVRLSTFTTLAATYGANFKYGTLVIKSDALQDDTVMTKENLKTLGAVEVATELLYYTDDFAVLGAAYTVDSANYDTKYTAVTYMEVKTADGKTHTYCSAVVAERSVSSVARSAIRDLKPVADGVYKYEVDGKYSRYTQAERERLASYIG